MSYERVCVSMSSYRSVVVSSSSPTSKKREMCDSPALPKHAFCPFVQVVESEFRAIEDSD